LVRLEIVNGDEGELQVTRPWLSRTSRQPQTRLDHPQVESLVALEVLMRIEELLVDPRRREHAAMPEADALTEVDALQEAQLLDVRLDALRSTVWLLFDCRGALQIEMGNTAVIVAYGLHRFSWVAQPRGRLTAWTVVSSEPVARGGVWSLSLAFVPSARLELEADSAEFFVGNVPGGDEAPPNYMEADDATIRAGLQSWTSTFEPVHAVFLDPASADPS
jgi:hypothetical protein